MPLKITHRRKTTGEPLTRIQTHHFIDRDVLAIAAAYDTSGDAAQLGDMTRGRLEEITRTLFRQQGDDFFAFGMERVTDDADEQMDILEFCRMNVDRLFPEFAPKNNKV